MNTVTNKYNIIFSRALLGNCNNTVYLLFCDLLAPLQGYTLGTGGIQTNHTLKKYFHITRNVLFAMDGYVRWHCTNISSLSQSFVVFVVNLHILHYTSKRLEFTHCDAVFRSFEPVECGATGSERCR